MLVCACVDGYSAHLRDPDMSDFTEQVVKDLAPTFVFKKWRANLFRRRRYALMRWLVQQQNPSKRLVLVGKSLGAVSVVRAWNALGDRLSYQKVGIVTIDPCWPLLTDWTPNLNNEILLLKHRPTLAINVYVIGTSKMQCGAQILGANTLNRAVLTSDHFQVIQTKATRAALCEVLGTVLQ